MQDVFSRPTRDQKVREESMLDVLQKGEEVDEGGARATELVPGHEHLQDELLYALARRAVVQQLRITAFLVYAPARPHAFQWRLSRVSQQWGNRA